MYRGGRRSVVGTSSEPPPSTTQPLLHNSTVTTTTSAKMHDAVTVCQPSLGTNYTSNTATPNLMSRLKELGMEPHGRPNFHSTDIDTKRKWTSTGSTTDQDSLKKRSPSIPVAPESTDPNNKQYILSRLFQEISQAESKQWRDIPDVKVNNKKVRLPENNSLLPGRQTAGSGGSAAFRLSDRNASASPSEDHAAPELELRQARSPDLELCKRAGSVSSEDAVDVEPVRGGRGRSQSRNNNNNNSNFTVSKNLVSERKRRKKLNDGLYSLRALVPKISKMDKASIVGDAIEHVKELQQQIEAMEMEIGEMECQYTSSATALVDEDSGASRLSDSHGEHVSTAAAVVVVEAVACKLAGEVLATDNILTVASTDDKISLADSQSPSPAVDQKRILKMEVSKLEEKTYQLQISCQKGPGVLVQLTQALESLDMDVLNAYHTSFQESILNTFIAEMKNVDMRGPEVVRRTVLDALAQHGLTAQS